MRVEMYSIWHILNLRGHRDVWQHWLSTWSDDEIRWIPYDGRSLMHLLASCAALHGQPEWQLHFARTLVAKGVYGLKWVSNGAEKCAANALYMALENGQTALAMFLLRTDQAENMQSPYRKRRVDCKDQLGWLLGAVQYRGIPASTWRPIAATLMRTNRMVTNRAEETQEYGAMVRDAKCARRTCYLLAGIFQRRPTSLPRDVRMLILRTCYEARYDDCWAEKQQH